MATKTSVRTVATNFHSTLRYWIDDIERRLADVTRPGYMTMSSLYQLVSRRERPLYVITHLRPIELTNNERL